MTTDARTVLRRNRTRCVRTQNFNLYTADQGFEINARVYCLQK
jgi:hypothetical protein